MAEIDRAALRKYVAKVSAEAAYRGAQKARGRVMANMIRLGRIDTGEMIRRTQVRNATSASYPSPGKVYRVGTTVYYAWWQEHGTKAHGPKRAKFMVFKPKGSQSFVFAKWVRGVTPGRFFQDALRDMNLDDFLP